MNRHVIVVLLAVAVLVAGFAGAVYGEAEIDKGYRYPSSWQVPAEFLANGRDDAMLTYTYGGAKRTWDCPVTYREEVTEITYESFPIEGGQYPVYRKEMIYDPDWPKIATRTIDGYFTPRRYRTKMPRTVTDEYMVEREHLAARDTQETVTEIKEIDTRWVLKEWTGRERDILD